MSSFQLICGISKSQSSAQTLEATSPVDMNSMAGVPIGCGQDPIFLSRKGKPRGMPYTRIIIDNQHSSKHC